MVWTPFADDHEIKDYIQCLFPCVLLLRLVFEVPLFQSFQNWTMLFPSFSLSLSLFFLAFHMIWNLDSSVDTPLGNIFYLTDLGSKKFSNPISSILLVVYKAKYRESIFWKAVVHGRPVCRTVASSISMRSDSHSQWMFFNLFIHVPEEFVCFGMMMWGTSLFFFFSFYNKTLVLDFVLFFSDPFLFLFFSFCNGFCSI